MRRGEWVVASAWLAGIAAAPLGCTEPNPFFDEGGIDGTGGSAVADTDSGVEGEVGEGTGGMILVGGKDGGPLGRDAGVDVPTLPCTPAGCAAERGPAPCGAWQCMAGACAVVCPNCQDGDHDGFGTGTGCAGPDCDDNDSTLGVNGSRSCYTGPAGTLGKGTCRAGTQICVSGALGPCGGMLAPTGEACNGEDDDCDGQTDEELGTAGCGLGACRTEVPACRMGGTGTCTPTSPMVAGDDCGGGDEDCDGTEDEDCQACVRVASGGDDSKANGTSALPFRSIMAAVEYAAGPGRPKRVCVAGGPTCAAGQRADFAETLVMRNGISVIGNFESQGWQRCPMPSGRLRLLTTIVAKSEVGVVFPVTVKDRTVLDGFEIRRHGSSETAAVTVEGATGAVIANVLVPDGPGANVSYAVNLKGGAATLVGVSLHAGLGDKLAVGVRVVGGVVRIQESCASFDAEGRCQAGCGGSEGLGVRGRFVGEEDDADDDNESYAVLLDNAAGSVIERSALCGNAAGRGAALKIRGKAAGTVVRGSFITAWGGATDSHGVWFEACGGASPRLGTSRIEADGRVFSTRVASVRSEGDCHPVIDNNVSIGGGNEIAQQNATVVECVAANGVASGCFLAANAKIGGSPEGNALSSVGVSCQGGSCARLSRNQIDGGEGEQTLGLFLGKSGPFVDRNRIVGGCGESVSRSVRALDAHARLENNVFFGSRCTSPGSQSSVTQALQVLASTGTSSMDVHSNLLDAGGPGMCNGTSLALEAAGDPKAVSTGIFRNNILRAGSCGNRTGVWEGSRAIDPAVFQHNNLDLAGTAVLYFDETNAKLTIEQINALADSQSGRNISVDARFVAYPLDLNLSAASMCRDAGTTQGAPARDMQGLARDNTPDIGPHEYLAR